MIDDSALERMQKLMDYYEINWGRKVEMTPFPRNHTQEKAVKVLERIVETGESFIVGYNKLFNEH